jgi:hypothetical protein
MTTETREMHCRRHVDIRPQSNFLNVDHASTCVTKGLINFGYHYLKVDLFRIEFCNDFAFE